MKLQPRPEKRRRTTFVDGDTSVEDGTLDEGIDFGDSDGEDVESGDESEIEATQREKEAIERRLGGRDRSVDPFIDEF
jgi:hypothetical protein